MILNVVEQDRSNVHLTVDRHEKVRRRFADPDPAFASDEQVEAAYRSFGKK